MISFDQILSHLKMLRVLFFFLKMSVDGFLYDYASLNSSPSGQLVYLKMKNLNKNHFPIQTKTVLQLRL